MRFYVLFIITALILLVPGHSVLASQIGVIMTGNIEYYQKIHDSFFENMGNHTHKIVVQKPMPDPMSWTNAARKLTAIGSDVIVSYGAPAALMTMKATAEIPIIFAGVFDPGSMSMTGKNATGISSAVSIATVLKHLSAIKKISKLGIILSKSEKDTILQTKQIKKIESTFGFQSVLIAVKNKINTDRIRGVDALLLTTCSTGMMNVRDIVEIARRDKIPTAAFMGGGESEGIILTVQADPKEQGKELAGMVRKILNGADVSDIPLREPKNIEITVNLKEATGLALNIPDDLMNKAATVIE